MITRYDPQTHDATFAPDPDGLWVQWEDVRALVDEAISYFNQDDYVGGMKALLTIVDREERDQQGEFHPGRGRGTF